MKRLLSGRRAAAAALLALVTVATAACADKGAPSAGASDTPSVVLSDIAAPTAPPPPAPPPAPRAAAGRGSAGVLEAVPEPDSRFLDGLSG